MSPFSAVHSKKPFSSRVLAAFALCALATAATACGDDDGDQCSAEVGCPSGSTCLAGICIPDDAGRGCASNSECGARQVCARTATRTACVPDVAMTICDDNADLARACEAAISVLGGMPTFCVGDRFVTCTATGGTCDTCASATACDLDRGCTTDGPDGGPPASCMVDDDCATGVCEEGTCAECRVDGDCSEGVCGDANECVECTADDDCAEGVCGDANECVECRTMADCTGGLVCVANACVADTGDGGPGDAGPDGGRDAGPMDGGGDMGGGDMGTDGGGGLCGNGVIDVGEECDPPMSGGCMARGCSDTCLLLPQREAACGDGCADVGEVCGEPGLAACTMGTRCAACQCSAPVCGDGTLDPGERCGEPGAMCNAGQTCTDCRCAPAVCGDGAVDGVESCGEPGLPACPMGQVCSTTTCTCGAAAACGDGTADMGEECGEPSLAACAAGSTCVACACVRTCGDGVAAPTESCGEPGLTCPADADCNTATCTCVGRCGNGRMDPGETCDPPNAPSCASSTYCDGRCQLLARPAMCGNGCLDVGEQCGEPGAPGCPMGMPCNSACRCMAPMLPPMCGDGVLNPGEECDPPGGGCAPGDTCELTGCTCVPLVGAGRPFALIGAQSDAELVTVFEGSATLPIVADSAYTLVPAMNTGVILVGDFVMIGINARGNLNTPATTGSPLILGFDPAGDGTTVGLPMMVPGYPNSASGFAFRSNATDPFREDVMSPGCLCEGWGVRYDEGATPRAGDAALAGAAFGNNAVGTFFGYFFDALRRAWRVRTRATVNNLEVTMDWSLRRGDRYVPERIQLRNMGAVDFTNLRFTRSLDYDVAVNRPGGMGFDDQFDFLYTPANGIPQLIRSREVPATDDYYGVATASPHVTCADGITFMQTDPDAFDSCNLDPADMIGDLSSSFVFRPTISGIASGTLPAGMSVEL